MRVVVLEGDPSIEIVPLSYVKRSWGKKSELSKKLIEKLIQKFGLSDEDYVFHVSYTPYGGGCVEIVLPVSQGMVLKHLIKELAKKVEDLQDQIEDLRCSLADRGVVG